MCIFSKILTFFYTIRYLKAAQVYARGILYFKKLKPQKEDWNQLDDDIVSQSLNLKPSIPLPISNRENSFSFLDLKKDFGTAIDWNFLEYGRLWNYNLNYFDYLDQENSDVEEGKRLIGDFISQISNNRVGLEPYPLSLRCINWIRFLVRNRLKETEIDSILNKQLKLLIKKLEYHLLGNHLLENGFALLFGAYYFNNQKFYKVAKGILIPELNEQILPDGAHFELSPMYHSIMLFRLLDCYNLVAENNLFGKELEPLLKEKSSIMLAWLKEMTFRNGNFPLMNDAAFCIAPTTFQLVDYAASLGISSLTSIRLKESGYRKFKTDKFELIVDVGPVGPDYQPGHAHADTFSFELHVNGRPVIVDTGTSTYEINETRQYERSTAAHNTVTIGDKNSSEVWAGHRVGRRAKVHILEDGNNVVSASHDGYRHIGNIHRRRFEVSGSKVRIDDSTGMNAISFLHLAPNEDIVIDGNSIKGKDYIIECQNAEEIKLRESFFSVGFNKRIKNLCVCIYFKDDLTMSIK